MKTAQTQKNLRPLQIATAIAVIFGVYFVWNYMPLVVLALILSFLFNPLYRRLKRKFKKEKTAASATMIIALTIIVLPVVLVSVLTVYQIKSSLETLTVDNPINLGTSGEQLVQWYNQFASHIPGLDTITLSQLQGAIVHVLSQFAQGVLSIITSSISGITMFITNFIIFMYVFVNLLTHQEQLVEFIKRINPLGRKRTEVYLDKMSSMTKTMVKGQFIIALVQGLTGAILLYIVGFHSFFIFYFLVLATLSLIPLGCGILLIPLGIILLLTGNIWQGLVILLGHFFVITNEDNFLRSRIVQREVYLNPALTMLAVFSGVGFFGFFGIIIGPVLMILIVSTLDMYLDAIRPSSATST